MTSADPQSPRSRSQAGGRRPLNRPALFASTLHSDCPPEPEDSDSPGLGQRSVSLTTLQPTVIQPRMAQLETLEAKMASIEVSLSSTPRRKKNGSLSGISLGSSIRSIPKEIAAKELENLRNALRDKENIIQSLKGQLTIPGLRLSSVRNGPNNNINNNNHANNRELTDLEKKQAEERLTRLKTDVDNKRLAIKNLKMALERLDITDNIDVRIQQAELEYQLGREELNLLTLLEETRALQLCLDESNRNSADSHTLYSCVCGQNNTILLGVEVDFDTKSPKFGAGQKDSTPGLWVDWALEETGLFKGDRLVEVNGKIVLTKNRDDLTRLLAAAPDPAQIVILRKHQNTKEAVSLRSELEAVRERAEQAQKSKDALISDNIRLTHRISYLEEQVSELISRKKSEADNVRILSKAPVISTVKTNQNVTNINITTQPLGGGVNSNSQHQHHGLKNNNNNNHSQSEVQVFQKGPQVTALVANIPGIESSKDSVLPVRSKSSLSNVSNTHIPAPSYNQNQPPENYLCHKNHSHRHKHRSRHSLLQTSVSAQNLDQTADKITYRKHNHHHHRDKDYNSETNSAIEPTVTRYNKRNGENGHSSILRYPLDKSKSEKELNGTSDIMDQSYKKATKIVHELTRSSRDSTLYEKHRQKCITASEKYNTDLLRHYNARKSTSVLDFRSEIHIGPKYSDSKSAEELDAVEPGDSNNKRLYKSKKIQDSRSVKSLDFDSDCNSTSTNGYKTGYGPRSVDYTSEPIVENGGNHRKLLHYTTGGYYGEGSMKPRPTPPKKPLRLSLHKTQSLQSVETPPMTPDGSPPSGKNGECRKRNYKGEMPVCNNGGNGFHDGSGMKWFNQKLENGLEGGSWC